MRSQSPQRLQKQRTPSARISSILDATNSAQSLTLSAALNPLKSDSKFISCYLSGSTLLLDACVSVQLRLASIRQRLESIPAGLSFLEAEHEPSRDALRQGAETLKSSRLGDRQHCSKMEKRVSRIKAFGKKLAEEGDGASREVGEALSGAWAAAALAVRILCEALTTPEAEPWAGLLEERRKRIEEESGSMEELAGAESAIGVMIKLVSAWRKGGGSRLRRMAVKTVARELRRRKEELEKALPSLEERIEELCRLIVALRVRLEGLLQQKRDGEADGTQIISSTAWMLQNLGLECHSLRFS